MKNTEKDFYRQKYLKYKAKYLEAKNQMAGYDVGKFGFDCSGKGWTLCTATPGCGWEGIIKRGSCWSKSCSDYSGVISKCTSMPGCKTEGNYKCVPK